MRSFRRRNGTAVGLDVGSSLVKAVEVRTVGTACRVSAIAIEPVPGGSIVDGAIVDGPAVTNAIRRAIEAGGFATRDVVASLSGHAVIVKRISVPKMPEAELAGAIAWVAEPCVPFDIHDVNLDYQILEPGPGEPSPGTMDTMDVLLVAAKKERIAERTAVITRAGCVPVAVDIDAFALQNAYEINYGVEPGAVVMLLNVGASAINVNIIRGDSPVFTRDIPLGGNTYTEALQRELHLALGAAEQVTCGEHLAGVNSGEVRLVLRAVTANVLFEIRKTFEFFTAAATSDRLDRIVVSGGAGTVDGFLGALEERFRVPVEALNPFRRVALDGTVNVGHAERMASTLAVAAGLALRGTRAL